MNADEQAHVVPTLADVASTRRSRRARNLRRVGVVVLLIVAVFACLDLLGPTSATTSANGPNGSRVEIEFPERTRPGLESEVSVTLSAPVPITEDVLLVVDAAMYDEFGLEQVVPEPSEQQSLGSRLRMTFEPPPEGRVMSITFAGRIPAQQLPGSYQFNVDARVPPSPAVETGFRTWVLP